MPRILIPALVFVSAFLYACGESPEKTASREYVKAANKVVSAKIAFESADYPTAYTLCNEAREDVKKIVETHSETPVALKVVTDSSTMIGVCTVSELNDKILPILKSVNNENLYPVDMAWAIAITSPSASRDNAIAGLAQNLIISNKFADKKRDMILACAAQISDPDLKIKTLKALSDKNDAAQNSQSVKSVENKNSVASDTTVVSNAKKIPNEDLFIKQALSDASLVAYDMRASDNLRLKALDAKSASDKLRGEFSKALKIAQANVMKISVSDMREKALATLALAYSNFGDIHNAIAIAQSLENPKLFADVFDAIAKQASSGKDYTLAIALATKIPEGKDKNDFLIELTKGVASQGLISESSAIAGMLKDIASRNMAYANAAKIALAKNDKKSFVDIISKIDVSAPDKSWASIFDFVMPVPVDDKTYKFSHSSEIKMAYLAAELIASNAPAELSKKFTVQAKELCDAIPAQKVYEFALMSDILCANMAALGMVDEAIKYASLNLERSDIEFTFKTVCNIATTIVVKDKKTAAKAFAVAANLGAGLPRQNIVRLAFLMQLSGIERSECVRILKPFLPSFK